MDGKGALIEKDGKKYTTYFKKNKMRLKNRMDLDLDLSKAEKDAQY